MNFNEYYENIYSKKHEKIIHKNGKKKTVPKKLLHFDYCLSAKSAYQLVTSPSLISKHWFLPLLGFDLSVRKTKLEISATGKVTRVRENKPRPIRYASNRDGYIYSYYSYIFSKKYETFLSKQDFEKCPIAYRSLEKSNIDFAKDIFQSIKKIGESTVVCIDLSSFFDTLDHSILKKNLQKVLDQHELLPDQSCVINSLTKYSFFNRDIVIDTLGWHKKEFKNTKSSVIYKKSYSYDKSLTSLKELRKIKDKNGQWVIRKNPNKDTKGTTIGIPQGTPISALLSNIYMIEFDKEIYNYTNCNNGLYRRYCDDILLILPGNWDYDELLKEISKILRDTAGESLIINQNKTEAIYFFYDSGKLTYKNLIHPKKNYELQYLGFNFNGNRTIIRQSSIARYYRKLTSKINTVKYKAEKNPINSKPFLRDIYQKYSHISNQKTFISYVKRASIEMGEKGIMKQVKNHVKYIQDNSKI